MKNKILLTIQKFKSSNPKSFKEKYMCGDCYVFARALVEKFNGEIFYLAVDNHFIAQIENEFYDIRGIVPLEELYECYPWEVYKIIESLDADRVEYYCINGKEILHL